MRKKKIAWVLAFLFFPVASFPEQFTVLHSFSGSTSDGAFPYYGSLALDSSALYGMTKAGGTSNLGAIFKINKDGTGFQLLHSFTGGTSDGKEPYGSLILNGSTVFGMTIAGGASDLGTIFRINTDGTGFELLHSFTGADDNGANPYGSLILIGSTLYGMTSGGGSNAWGAIFKIDTDGNGFTLLHSFTGGNLNGADPYGSLLLSGSTLYGMTLWGGIINGGTIFRINTDGTAFAVIHSFTGASDGWNPYGTLIVDGSTLYGMTAYGGPNDWGTIFKINADGTGYSPIHYFDEIAQWPWDSLIFIDSNLYGMSWSGGDGGVGTVFRISTNGTGFELLHAFTGDVADGGLPYGSLVQDGSLLFGMTQHGGASNLGVVFSLDTSAVPITVATSPAGLQITVDEASATAPQTYYWAPGSTHSIGVDSPQSGATGTRYVYSFWSDDGDQTHTITTPSSETTYTASFAAQYSLMTMASPEAGGAVTPVGTNWYDENQEVQVQATSKSGYVFTGWSGDLTGYTNPTTVTLSGPKNVTANFISGRLNSPVLDSPANNATRQPTTVTLKWFDTNSSPQELKYKVRIKIAGGTYTNYILSANTVQYIKSGLTLAKTYYWNVQALGNGTTIKNSLWANGGVDFKFTVQAPAILNMPTLVAPANNSTEQPRTITFQWLDTNSNPQEASYKIRLKAAGGAYTIYTVPANSVSLLKSGLSRNKTYYWSVRAKGNGTTIINSAWPADWRFTTGQ